MARIANIYRNTVINLNPQSAIRNPQLFGLLCLLFCLPCTAVDLVPKSIPVTQQPPVIRLTSAAVVAPGGTNLPISWEPSGDSEIVGYNFYSGPSEGLCTNEIGVGSASSFVASNITARTWFFVSSVNWCGQESFSDPIFWPPYTNIILVTGATNMASALNAPRLPISGSLAFTNPPGCMFFFGNPATITHLIQ